MGLFGAQPPGEKLARTLDYLIQGSIVSEIRFSIFIQFA